MFAIKAFLISCRGLTVSEVVSAPARTRTGKFRLQFVIHHSLFMSSWCLTFVHFWRGAAHLQTCTKVRHHPPWLGICSEGAVAQHPLRSDAMAAPRRLQPSPAVGLWPPALQGFFLLRTHTIALMVWSYADSSELSYSYTFEGASPVQGLMYKSP